MENIKKMEERATIKKMWNGGDYEVVQKAKDGRWRYISRRVGGERVMYLQMKNKRGAFGREIRASVLKSGGFSNAYKKQIIKNIETKGKEGVPAPSGYKVSTTNFLNGEQSFRLVNVKPQFPERKAKDYLMSKMDFDAPRNRNVVRQFNLRFYARVGPNEKKQDRPFLTIKGKKYKLLQLYGQDPIIVLDVDRAKREVWKKWQRGWNTTKSYDGRSGKELLQRLAELLKDSGDESEEVGEQVENMMSFFDENEVEVRFENPTATINVRSVQPISFLTQLVREQQPKLDSRYINYFVGDNVENGVVFRNIADIYKPNLCGLSFILEAFHEPSVMKRLVDRRRTSFTNMLSYEALASFLFPEYTLEQLQDRGVCFDEIVPFFKHWKIAFYVYDVKYNLRHSYEPEERNQTIRPNRINAQQYQRHYYLMNDNLRRLEQLSDETPEGQTTCQEVGFYKPREDVEEDRIVVAWTMEECAELLVKLNIQYTAEKKEKEDVKPFRVFTHDIFLPALVVYVREKIDFEVSVGLKNTSQIAWVAFGGCLITSMTSKYCGEPAYQSKDALVYLLKCNNRLYNGCFGNPAWRSVYNPLTYKLLSENKPLAIRGSFTNDKVKGYTKYDVKKCFTAIVRDMKFLPRINGFDTLEEHDGSDIDDWSLYYVKKLGNDGDKFPFRRYSLVFGSSLKSKNADKVDILGVLKVSHKVKNLVADKYKSVFEDKRLIELEENGTAEGARKWLLNSTTGMFGSHIKSAWEGDIFDSVEEARAFVDENGGGVRYFSVKNEDGSVQNTDLFLQYKKQWKVLKDGYMLIHHWIIERSVMMMLELKRDLESVGYKVYNINTDCCDVNTDANAELKFKAKFASKWFKEGTEWAQIGGLRVEHYDKWLYPSKSLHDVVNNFVFGMEERKKEDDDDEENEMIGKVEWNDDDGWVITDGRTLELDTRGAELVEGYDEWDVKSVHKALGRVCCIEAIYPGSGKSYVSKKLGGDVLFITPNNKIATNLMKEAYDAITTDRLFGSRMKRHTEVMEMEEGKLCGKFNLGYGDRYLFNYDYLTFDELTLNSVDKIYSIKKFVEKYADKFKGIYLNYDPFQNNSPDEKLENIDKVREYKLKICRSIAGRFIILKEMKRNRNAENFKHYEALFEMLKKNDRKGMIKYLLENCQVVHSVKDIKTDITISYTNDQCDLINAHTYKRLYGNKPLSVGMKMIYKGTSQIVGKCKMRFFKNDEYEIKAIENNHVVLTHLYGEETITKSQLVKLFKLPYCWTGHSTQGSTINEPYTIDINCFFCDPEWLWTCATRCDDWSLITIYHSNDAEREFRRNVEMTARRLIKGYVDQDIKAERWIKNKNDYIDLKWIMDQLINGACHHCGNPFEISGGMDTFSVDRIENEFAHLKNNSQMCCRTCNSIKR